MTQDLFSYPFWGNSNSQCSTLKYFLLSFYAIFFSSTQVFFLIRGLFRVKIIKRKFGEKLYRLQPFKSQQSRNSNIFLSLPTQKKIMADPFFQLTFTDLKRDTFHFKSTQLMINPHGSAQTLSF